MTRILWIHAKPVLGNHGGAELRTRTLLTPVVGAGHTVLLAQQRSESSHTRIAGVRHLDLPFRQDRLRYMEKLRSRRPLCAPAMRRANWRSARATAAAFEPELCIVSELVSFDTARRLMPAGCPWIYEAHNVEPELFGELCRMEPNPIRRAAFAVDARRFARDEALALAQADAVAAVSQSDLDKLRRRRHGIYGIVAPSSVPIQPQTLPAYAPPTVLFVGMLSYLPNIEAVSLLIHKIMPAVRQQEPQARLLVIGRDPGNRLRHELGARPWCELHENVVDLAPFYDRARCVAIPLQTGSGTRLKTYEAMSYGVPVVGSPLAFEGIDIDDGKTGCVATDSGQFTAAIADLLLRPDAASRIGRESWDYFNSNLAPDRAATALLELIEQVAARSRVVACR